MVPFLQTDLVGIGSVHMTDTQFCANISLKIKLLKKKIKLRVLPS